MAVDIKVDYPDTDEIEPHLARILFEELCAIIIIEDLPVGSEFGVDLMAHRVREKFLGMKMIPPGVHFVYASAISKNHQQIGPRTGFFHNFKPREIHIVKWSALEEDFDDSYCANEERRDSYRSNLRDLDRYLGAYRYSTYKTYLSLVDKLTPDVVLALVPDCHRVRSVPYLIRDADSNSSHEDSKQAPRIRKSPHQAEEDLLPNLKADPKTVIHFTDIPLDRDASSVLDHRMITQYNLDSTMKLENTFRGEEGRSRLLAELQFSFLTFLLCHVYGCFEHWKKIVNLVCLADSGLRSYPEFYHEFVQALLHQVDHIPDDLFEEITDDNNLLRRLLDTLFQNIEDSDTMHRDLKEYSSKLKTKVEEKFRWQFDLEPDDERPVIVNI